MEKKCIFAWVFKEIILAKKLADANIYHDGFVSIKIFNNKISLKGNLESQRNIDNVQSIIQELESTKQIENNIKLKSWSDFFHKIVYFVWSII